MLSPVRTLGHPPSGARAIFSGAEPATLGTRCVERRSALGNDYDIPFAVLDRRARARRANIPLAGAESPATPAR
jgi:hypothetical protein